MCLLENLNVFIGKFKFVYWKI